MLALPNFIIPISGVSRIPLSFRRKQNDKETLLRLIVRNRNMTASRLRLTRCGGARKTVSRLALFDYSLGGKTSRLHQSVIILTAYGFKPKWLVSRCKTGLLAARNGPFRNAIWPVLRRVSCRPAPLVVLFGKWERSAKGTNRPRTVCPPAEARRPVCLVRQPPRRGRLFRAAPLCCGELGQTDAVAKLRPVGKQGVAAAGMAGYDDTLRRVYLREEAVTL